MSSFSSRFTHYFLLFAIALLPWQPLMFAKEDQAQAKLLAKIMKQVQGPSQHGLGKLAMGKIADFDEKKAIITSVERKELQLSDLAKKLDKTITTFGSVALAQSLQPIANFELILQRQAWAKSLLDDEKLYADIQLLLKRIKKTEDKVLAYWDTAQRESGSKLFARAEGFYFNLLKMVLGEKINENKWALEGAMAYKMVSIAWDALAYFGGQKLWWDMLDCELTGKDLNPWQSIVDGVKSPVMFMWPGESKLADKIRAGKASSSEVLAAGAASTLGDTALFGRKGLKSRAVVKFGVPGVAAWWVGDKREKINNGIGALAHDYVKTPIHTVADHIATNYIPGGVKDGVHSISTAVKDHTPDVIKNNVGMPGLPRWKDMFGEFKPNGDWVSEAAVTDIDQLQGFAWLKNGALGWSGALAWNLAYKLPIYFGGVHSTYHSTKNAIRTMKELHIHTMHLARFFSTVREIATLLEQHPILKSSSMFTHITNGLTNASPELQKLLELLNSRTFEITEANARTNIFSRGNVFLAHRLMTKVHKEVVSLLHGIGILDALYAMVKNVKEATPQAPFSFVEFVPNVHAMIDIKNGWLPLVKNAVPNTITCGGNVPNKAIITGPNGCGKSVFLKLEGAIAVMAQSFAGIVSAEQVRMTPLQGIRSCIHPEESLEHELSTFMAEKLRIDAIKQFVFTHQHDPNFRVMLLLDEPFRGTVDAESADRIYEFGKDIASLYQAIVLIATHVEKPIHLAHDTNNAFTNYHVCIKELADNRFERAFTLEPGVLEWWFTDAKKRSRFIDFVTMEKHKEQLAKMTAPQPAVA